VPGTDQWHRSGRPNEDAPSVAAGFPCTVRGVKRFVAAIRLVAVVALALAAFSALVGFLVAHFTGAGDAVHGIGWGMAIGGALTTLVIGQSGSPSRMSVEGRWGAFGHLWGDSAALPESPLWLLAVALLVCAGGIAVVVLA
jgi:hypothetical protein